MGGGWGGLMGWWIGRWWVGLWVGVLWGYFA